MPRPALRSRSFARTRVTTPSGRTRIKYRRKQPSPASCAQCKGPLAGVPRGRRNIMATLPKTKCRPERPFGGQLCSPCTRKLLIEKARAQ
ncbi:MAG: 50S ribosomal protein L34e [Nanoarchaeota archaeon]|nr:50S ribosomal protein L34e [Nanoarchaeota archaeon]